ncbi:MAG: DUF3667 domain-containing protein, partial [Owenweeksia sp.]
MDGLATAQTCKNCESEFSGSFCSQCGQKYIEQRVTLKYTLSSLFQSVFNFDKGLWPTTWMVFRNPGKVIKDYLRGVTVPYFHPFRFVFFWLTVQVILMVSTGLYKNFQQNLSGEMDGKGMGPELEGFMTMYYTYMNIFFIIALPALAFGSWLLFRKRHYNYAEHLVISAYSYGGVTFLGLISIPLMLLAPKYFLYGSAITMPLTFIYLTYVYRSLFRQNLILIFFKTLLVFVIFMIGFTFITLAVLYVYFA